MLHTYSEMYLTSSSSFFFYQFPHPYNKDTTFLDVHFIPNPINVEKT